MRIGLFTDSYPPYVNGVSTSVETLKQALEKEGHIVYVVTVGQDVTTYRWDKENKILRVPGIPIGIYDYRASSIYPVKVVNRIKKWNLDVIHSHTELSMGIFARLLAKQYGIPLVHTYHTMYKDYTYYVSRNLKYFDMVSKKAVEYLSKFYCDNTANAFIVPTIKTYKMFREEYHYEKEIYIVPTGIDATRFYTENVNLDESKKLREKLGFKKNDFVCLFVGRMAQEKNVMFLLDVMKDLKKKNKRVKLLLVGYGPDEDKYRDYAIKNKLDNVTFAGKIAWEDMPKYYHTADASITASTTETQGLTVIEALASSLPVICIEDDAFHTMVIEGVNGRFFGDKKECIDIINELSKNKKQLNILSKQGIVTAKQYSTEVFAKSAIDVYKAAKKNYNEKMKKSLPTKIVDFFKSKVDIFKLKK